MCGSAGGGGVSLPRGLGLPSALHRLAQTPLHGTVYIKYRICVSTIMSFCKLPWSDMYVYLFMTGSDKGGASS